MKQNLHSTLALEIRKPERYNWVRCRKQYMIHFRCSGTAEVHFSALSQPHLVVFVVGNKGALIEKKYEENNRFGGGRFETKSSRKTDWNVERHG